MKLVATILFFFAFGLLAESDTLLLSKERELATFLEELRSAESDEDKIESNEQFKMRLRQFLNREGAMKHEFTLLRSIGVIDSPDKRVRIVNWNVEMEDLSHRYFCFVMHTYGKKDDIIITEFIDNPMLNSQMPDGVVQPDQWYGALYYQIIPVEKGSKDVYTLLGWDGYTTLSTIKVVDALMLTSSGARLGYPIFEAQGTIQKRLFYQFADKTTMYLHYEKENDRIMMDHLSPESPSLAGFYEFYVPDLSFDALIFDRKRWVLHEDVIGLNAHEGNPKDRQEVYTMDENGNLVKVGMKDNWQDPTDLSAPGGGNVHVAVTPDESEKGLNAESTDKKKDRKKDEGLKVDKRDKRDPSDLTIVNGKKKKIKKRNKKD